MNLSAEIISNQITENENSFLSPCCEAPRPDGVCTKCLRNQFEMATYQNDICHHEMKKWTAEIQELKQDVDAFVRKTNPEAQTRPLGSNTPEPEKEVRGDGDHELRVTDERMLDQQRSVVRPLVKDAAHHVDNAA